LIEGIQEDDAKKIRSNVLSFGADVNELFGEREILPFVFACSKGNPDVVNCLLELGATVNSQDEKGRNPLGEV